jgi:hypothetical protein
VTLQVLRLGKRESLLVKISNIHNLSIELETLKNLPEEYKYSTFETPIGLYIRVKLPLLISIQMFSFKLIERH